MTWHDVTLKQVTFTTFWDISLHHTPRILQTRSKLTPFLKVLFMPDILMPRLSKSVKFENSRNFYRECIGILVFSWPVHSVYAIALELNPYRNVPLGPLYRLRQFIGQSKFFKKVTIYTISILGHLAMYSLGIYVLLWVCTFSIYNNWLVAAKRS